MVQPKIHLKHIQTKYLCSTTTLPDYDESTLPQIDTGLARSECDAKPARIKIFRDDFEQLFADWLLVAGSSC